MQNFVYADIEGNIGYFAPGAIPIRPRANGTLPVPGWTGEDDWTGYVPLERVPRAFNPARGFVVTREQPGAPRRLFLRHQHQLRTGVSCRPHHRDGRGATHVDRGRRGAYAGRRAVGAGRRPATVAAPRANRSGTRPPTREHASLSGTAQCAPIALPQRSSRRGRAQQRDGFFADELGSQLWQEYDQEPAWRTKALHAIAGLGESPWCDDVTTEPHETCAAPRSCAR